MYEVPSLSLLVFLGEADGKSLVLRVEGSASSLADLRGEIEEIASGIVVSSE